jgi:hypothetical protein
LLLLYIRYIHNFSNIITRETSLSCVRLSLLYSISHGYGLDYCLFLFHIRLLIIVYVFWLSFTSSDYRLRLLITVYVFWLPFGIFKPFEWQNHFINSLSKKTIPDFYEIWCRNLGISRTYVHTCTYNANKSNMLF